MAAPFTKVTIVSRMWVIYDRHADVLHVRLHEDEPYEGEGTAGGVELDYALSDGRPSGAKVIGFRRLGWGDRLTELGQILGEHLNLGASDVSVAIANAVKRAK